MPHVYVRVGFEVRNGMNTSEAEVLIDEWLQKPAIQAGLPDGVAVSGVISSDVLNFYGDPPFNYPEE